LTAVWLVAASALDGQRLPVVAEELPAEFAFLFEARTGRDLSETRQRFPVDSITMIRYPGQIAVPDHVGYSVTLTKDGRARYRGNHHPQTGKRDSADFVYQELAGEIDLYAFAEVALVAYRSGFTTAPGYPRVQMHMPHTTVVLVRSGVPMRLESDRDDRSALWLTADAIDAAVRRIDWKEVPQ
jgi:hypothetical protein